jgi:spore coat protein CotH
VPAPRTGYANLTINGEAFGLYLNVENVDDVMLDKWYGADNTNHLYEGTYLGWSNQLDPFDGGYEVDEGDEDDRADLQNLYDLNNTDAEQWFDTMKDIVDFQNVVRMWAVERYSGHWDGYSADIVNNFYFHSDATNKFTMLPWGTDQTWGGDLDYSSVNGGTLFVNCMNVKRCRDMYVRAVETVRNTAQSLNLATYASEIYTGIRTHLDADPKKEHSIEDADWHASSTQSVISDQIVRVNRWSRYK